ncbi:chemotaxis protein CheR [Colwellia sp. PAMC 20917]|uniref:CheR family methyltransferase n=1 Tax=Colwellia sp. PAMC 20917 TaxID=1816218 RepID=UPI000877F12D|nr:protein-glutamate O-methyltransferase CheR [Colwellia sp. PAMC 20917]AOW77835.1 chemotaxis protein CheR [Colwellia sp. PAMC 20917]
MTKQRTEVVNTIETEKIEIDRLLEDIYQHHGYDFRSYARASIERRIRLFIASKNCVSISEIMPKLLSDREFFAEFISYFSVLVTELFRDSFVYRLVREQVVPLLKTWPHIKIWHAGCATGEEVYSLAIILKEEGIYDRTTIYATDISEEAIDKANEGIYEMAALREATLRYQRAGGNASFSDYYHARYNAAAMDAALKERIVFSTHNLATDSVFGEMHLIFCRNVLIYFNPELQNRALGLFTDSLVHGGFLCLGTKEDISFSKVNTRFEVVDEKAKVYRKQDRI